MSKNNTYNKENHLKQSDNNLISDNLIQNEEQFLKEYKSDKKTGLIYFFVVTSLLIGVFLISFNSGRYDMSIVDVINSIISGMKHGIWWLLSHIGFNLAEPTWMSGPEDTIIWLVRMPRIFATILIGGSLAVSGATYQGLFRNPMVSPDVLGASAGASVGACIMMLFNMGLVMIQIAAFVMGILAVALSYFLSKTIGKGTNVILLLVLCGMTVNTLFQALVSITKYLADTEEQLPAMTYWLMGSIAKVSYNDLKFFLIPFGLGVIPIVALRWKLNLLFFGEDEAKAMGIDVSKVRIFIY